MTTLDTILNQDRAIDDLRRAYLADRLPHGLVFAGPAGVGKGTTALALAALFLCERPQGTAPCGSCDSCRVIRAGNHPDYHVVYRQLVRMEKESSKARDLSIDVVRQYLVRPAGLRAAMGRGKVFVVEEAELMNAAAQNAILKTLEEPAGRTAIVLLTDQPDALLPTIRSRCQTFRFYSLPDDVVATDLAKRGIAPADAKDAARFARGSIGVALRWIDDGVLQPAREIAATMDELLAGRATDDLPGWLKKAAEAYADTQLKRDELASKDQATREGYALYLRLAAEHLRLSLAAENADPDALDRTCDAIDAIVRSEQYLDANVNTALVLQQLSVALEQALVPSASGRGLG